MTAATATTGLRHRHPLRRGGPIKRWWWCHPEAPAVLAVVGAWTVLVGTHAADHLSSSSADGWSFGIGSWSTMVVAMMVPGAVPAIRRVAFDSLWRRRHRNTALFVLGYLAPWIGFGVVGAALVGVAWGPTSVGPGRLAVAVGLVGAAGWQMTGAKIRALRRCHLPRPIAPRGWAATRSAFAYGAVHARSCMGSCWAIMAVMVLSGHDVHLMVPLTAITLVERYQRRPRPLIGAVGLLAVVPYALLG